MGQCYRQPLRNPPVPRAFSWPMSQQVLLERIIREAREVLLDPLSLTSENYRLSCVLGLRRIMALEAVQAEAFRADTLLAFVIRRLTIILRDDARTTSETIEEIRAVLFDHGLSDALGIPRSSLCMRTHRK